MNSERDITFLHCDSIWDKAPSGGPILEPTEEVIVPNSIEPGIVLEAVHEALALDGVGALHVVVVRQKHLLGAVELTPPTDGLLRPIIPPHPHLHPAPRARLDALHPRHVRRIRRVRRPHQHTVAGWQKPVGIARV